MKPGYGLIAALLLAAAIYCLGLAGPLVFDDPQNLAPLAQWVQGQRDWTFVVFGNESGLFGRPVSMASFVLNVVLLGPDISSLKLGNVVIHLANGVLVYLLFSLLLHRRALAQEGVATNRWLPLLGTAIWMLHPLLASTVLYVVQRMAMLASLFMLAAMISYLKGRLALEQGNRRQAWGLFALVVPCTLLAALSKENGILAPALCAVMELFVFAPPSGTRRPWTSRFVIGIGLLAPAMVAISLVLLQHPAVMGGYANRPFTLDERLLTQARVLWNYVGALVLPYGPRLGLFHDDFGVSHSLTDPPTTAVAILAWLGTLAVAWNLRKTIPGLALGLGIFLVGQAFESSIFPLLMYFEHRNYLPAVGAIWAMLSCAVYLAERLRPHMHSARHIFPLAAIGLVMALAVATAGRALVWQSQFSLLAQGLRQHPESRWLRISLVQQAMQQSDAKSAIAHADVLLASLDPSTRRLGATLKTMVICATSQPVPEDLKQTVFSGRPEPIEPDLLVALESLMEGLIAQPCAHLPPLNAATLLSALLDRSSLSPRSRSIWRLRLKAAKLYIAGGRPSEALRQAQLAWTGGAAEAPVPLLISALLLQLGDDAGAAKMLDAAQEKISPRDKTGLGLISKYRSELARRQLREPRHSN